MSRFLIHEVWVAGKLLFLEIFYVLFARHKRNIQGFNLFVPHFERSCSLVSLRALLFARLLLVFVGTLGFCQLVLNVFPQCLRCFCVIRLLCESCDQLCNFVVASKLPFFRDLSRCGCTSQVLFRDSISLCLILSEAVVSFHCITCFLHVCCWSPWACWAFDRFVWISSSSAFVVSLSVLCFCSSLATLWSQASSFFSRSVTCLATCSMYCVLGC